MKKLFFLIVWFGYANSNAQTYSPSPANLKARHAFQDDKFGLFIHFGLYSQLGDGEWVMNNKNIQFKDYRKLMDFFNPIEFNAQEWVALAKNAGMKYLTLVTRHHDGFSMWDTKYSDFNIMNSPYKKDIVKMLADECHKQGIKIGFYYSTLDWGREDYPHETGRTGKKTGRIGQGNYDAYFKYMKNQLTELLTQYGEVSTIWFDGHWDQTNEEGSKDRSSRIDWRYDELYSMIHQLQPQCLIGNNHHLAPFPGEDFQMFERDLPGENKSGLSFQQASDKLPIETCETMNNSWGFNIRDDHFKSEPTIIKYLVNAAGRNTNLLLNVGPMPNGKIQQEFVDTLLAVGKWMKNFGESIYGTRGNVIPLQDWGVVTAKGKSLFIHILKMPENKMIFIEGVKEKIVNSKWMGTEQKVKFSQNKNGLTLFTEGSVPDRVDAIIQLELK